jgi:TonB family protein
MHPTAAQSLFASKPEPLGRFVILSVAGHAAALVLFLGLSSLVSAPKVDLDAKVIHASLVRKGVKRDEKLLPRKDDTPPPPATAPQPAPTKKQDLFAAMDKTQKAPGDKNDARNKLFGAINKASKTPQDVEGDPNGDPNGDSATQEGERYWGVLSAQVRRYYDVSQTIPDAERIRLRARVLVRIGKSGDLLKVELTQKSDNNLFDQAVVAAVKKAAPFPPPPDTLRAALQSGGVNLEFTP